MVCSAREKVNGEDARGVGQRLFEGLPCGIFSKMSQMSNVDI